jgi:hypothetical protein
MSKSFAKCFDNKIGCLEIHIGDPHRDDIFSPESLLPEVKFNAISSFSVCRFIEVPHPKNSFWFQGPKDSKKV